MGWYVDDQSVDGNQRCGMWMTRDVTTVKCILSIKDKTKENFSRHFMIFRILVYFSFNTSQYSECLLIVSIKSIDQS